jgi:hypothetical protein
MLGVLNVSRLRFRLVLTEGIFRNPSKLVFGKRNAKHCKSPLNHLSLAGDRAPLSLNARAIYFPQDQLTIFVVSTDV